MNALLEFGKLLIPAAIVLYAVYLMVRSFIQREIDLKKLEVRGRSIETILPARLQAYERMVLFLERISPQNLLIRLNNPGLSARFSKNIVRRSAQRIQPQCIAASVHERRGVESNQKCKRRSYHSYQRSGRSNACQCIQHRSG